MVSFKQHILLSHSSARQFPHESHLSKIKVSSGPYSIGRFQGRSHFLDFSSFRRLPAFIRLTAPSSVLKAYSVVAASDLTWGRSSSCKDSWLHWVHLDSPRYAPHLKVLNHIWKIPLPRKVTYSWVLEMRRGPLWVLWSAFHTVESKDETLVQDKLLTGDLMKVISSSHYFFMTKFTTQCVPTPHTHKKTRGQVPARKTGDQMGTDLEWWWSAD